MKKILGKGSQSIVWSYYIFKGGNGKVVFFMYQKNILSGMGR
jgi:hypothetical protein